MQRKLLRLQSGIKAFRALLKRSKWTGWAAFCLRELLFVILFVIIWRWLNL